MNMLAGASATGLAEQEDRLGGGSWVIDTDVYEGTIKMAYLTKSAGGAIGVQLNIDFDGKEYRELTWVSNKAGEFYFTNQKGEKQGLPGFVTINDLCLFCTEKELEAQTQEEKVANVWDNELRKEVPKNVTALTDLLEKKVLVAINKNLENKTEKQPDGSYKDIPDTRDTNSIEKFFHPEKKVTISEAKRQLSEGEFIYAWLEKNKGNVRDKRSIKDGDAGGQSGRPGGAPNAGSGGTQRKSLFDN